MNPLKHMRIGYRLGVVFGFTLLMFVALLALALAEEFGMHSALAYYDQGVVPSIRAIHTALEGVDTTRRYEVQHLLSNDAAELSGLEG
ncbi:MAG TPA: hypothetical protein VNZ06_11970, partial [Steroidobacteraceae bacterium]|nr:hypothetical protein [Steroidobacteraceae bacterium]